MFERLMVDLGLYVRLFIEKCENSRSTQLYFEGMFIY